MALEDLSSWISRARNEVRVLVDQFEERFGYEPDSNEIRLAATHAEADLSVLPSPVRAFFSAVDAISWPDVWNGYFLGPAKDVVRGISEYDPGAVVVGSEQHRALVIGSDGGGGFFVLDLDASNVVLHVVEPVIRDGILRGAVRVVAPNFDTFLESLLENVTAVTNGAEPTF